MLWCRLTDGKVIKHQSHMQYNAEMMCKLRFISCNVFHGKITVSGRHKGSSRNRSNWNNATMVVRQTSQMWALFDPIAERKHLLPHFAPYSTPESHKRPRHISCSQSFYDIQSARADELQLNIEYVINFMIAILWPTASILEIWSCTIGIDILRQTSITALWIWQMQNKAHKYFVLHIAVYTKHNDLLILPSC